MNVTFTTKKGLIPVHARDTRVHQKPQTET